MILFGFGETATFVTRTATSRDADGNDVYTDVPVDITGCGFDPGGSFETLQSGDQVTTTPTLYAPQGALVPAAVDRVIIRGETYEVDGTPRDYRNPFTGWHPGPVVQLKRVEG